MHLLGDALERGGRDPRHDAARIRCEHEQVALQKFSQWRDIVANAVSYNSHHGPAACKKPLSGPTSRLGKNPAMGLGWLGGV